MRHISFGARWFGIRGIAALVALQRLGVFASVALAAATNTTPPAISGTPVEGQTLTVSTGTWTGTGPITYSYQWQRCNPNGSACADIGGAVANTYVLGSADVGNTVRAVVTATDTPGPPTSAPSATTTAVTAAAAAAPVSTVPPTITGTPSSGQTLTAVEGTFTGAAPDPLTNQWQRCDATGAACIAIPTATTKTYLVPATDVGATLRVRVTATNASGAASATSVPTAVIAAGAPASLIQLPGGMKSVAAADVIGSERLILQRFVVNKLQPIRSRSPFTITFRVFDTRGYVVRDALVYVIGLPYNRIRRVTEAKTRRDGTVDFRLLATQLQPLKLGARLVIFARARVEGQPLLAGASTRRLVEIVFGASRS